MTTLTLPLSPVPPLAPRAPDGRVSCDWAGHAIAILHRDAELAPETPLLRLSFPGLRGIDIHLKDESAHPTGSLKHRLARSLLLYGICNGQIRQGTTLVEASSGSTALSEAWFARRLGLPFIAVVPAATSPRKIAGIERLGGRCHFVDGAAGVYAAAQRIADETGGHYLDQFTHAERATDWRCGNIAESIFRQMQDQPHPLPDWVVMSAGTGGTSATIGRHIRYRNLPVRLCVADVEHSAFYDAYRLGDRRQTCATGSRIEGIGRPRVEPSFLPSVIDRMIRVPDAASIAAMRVLSERLGRPVGGSTGTNFLGLCWIAARMMARGREGSLVTIICDGGDRYADSYHDDGWLARQSLDIAPHLAAIRRFLDSGRFQMPDRGRGFRLTRAAALAPQPAPASRGA